jgi:hypothetical protein
VLKEFKQAFLQAFVETVVRGYPEKSRFKKVKLEDRSWSVWILETKEGMQLLSVQGYIDDAIPEDGSFIGAFELCGNLTEVEADQMMDRIAKERSASP